MLFVNNGFTLFFELLATHITWPSEDPAEFCQLPFMDLSNTAWAWKDLTKQSEVNVTIMNTTTTTSTMTSSHTTLGTVISIGPYRTLIGSYSSTETQSVYSTAAANWAGSVWRKSLLGTIQTCYILLWTNPGISTPQKSSYTAICVAFHKPFKMNKKCWSLQGPSNKWSSPVGSHTWTH